MNDYDRYNFPGWVPPDEHPDQLSGFSQDEVQWRPRRGLGILNKLRSDRPKLNLTLYILTFLSTWFVGTFMSGSVVLGLEYSGTIMAILTAHEMGHYLMSRKHGVPATLPFFIPFPFPWLNPFGTLGAIIRMDSRMPNRRALFDIGVAGPLAGLVITIPALILGLHWSQIQPLKSVPEGTLFLGESLLFKALSYLVVGHIPEGYDLVLHPIAFAGWAGLFVTALNLLPIGQLDGGHVLYAMFGRRSNVVYKIMLAAFAVICALVYWGWLLLILLLIWLGYRHPPPLDDFTPLDFKRRVLGVLTFLIFVVSFTPAPFKIA
ncbi:MAG: site-2 protease family protein [Calditrichaeota bacterium]|nr:site-2 protease family protein [Calditrichota bacterium]